LKQRVLIFTTAYKPLIGGAELALEEVTKRLPEVFFDIITARFSDAPVYENRDNVAIYRVGSKWSLPLLGAIAGLKLAQKHSYAAFHAFQASYGAMAGALLSLIKPAVPFIVTLQEGKNLPLQNIFIKIARNLILKRASKITAISEYLANFAKKVNSRAEIIVIPNGVNVAKFSIFNFQFSKKQKTVITISRLVPKNGIDILIKAMKNLPYRLVIVGDGIERQKLINLARNLGVADRVDFIGPVPNKIICDYLQCAFVFTRPSRSEGLGTAFLEAMAAGVPVIGTPVGGIPDFLKHEETGLLVPTENPEELAKAITRIYDDSILREKLAANGFALVKEKYDWDKIAKQYYETLYRHSGI